jgi:alkanesulfonate monooxygenase SsuD/methylene tetrahydromethanopterin reductase-like flavin-dependent oxidoreductase (luciferase family)
MLGFHRAHEQHPPAALLPQVTLAAEAGFTAAMCSDRVHRPSWRDRQRQSGCSWNWLGAALRRTPMSFGTVCAPGQRDHPAVIAQAAASLQEMFPDRCWLAAGSGEALNASITGRPRAPKAQRDQRRRPPASVLWQRLSGEAVLVSDVWREFPGALLERVGS